MAASMIRKKSLSFSLSLHSSVRPIYLGTEMKANLMDSKTMKKIMKKAERKKDASWLTPIYEKKPALNFNRSGKAVKSKQRFSVGMQRRANHIGDVMYDTVCTIIGTGQLGVRATIIKVDVIPDMTYMNVYWEASGDQAKDEQTQLELNQNANYLRKMLIESNRVGSVPKPVFVKDFSMSKKKNVEDLLLQIRLELEKETANTSEVIAEFDSDLDVVNAEGLDLKVYKESVSDDIEREFRQDLYDIPHDVLMSKVVAAKASASHRPLAMSDTNYKSDNFSRFDRELKKLLTPKKEISKKKLFRQVEREELDNLEKELNESKELKDEEFENFDEASEDNAGIDTWMQGYHEELSNDGDKSK